MLKIAIYFFSRISVICFKYFSVLVSSTTFSSTRFLFTLLNTLTIINIEKAIIKKLIIVCKNDP